MSAVLILKCLKDGFKKTLDRLVLTKQYDEVLFC